MEYWCGSKLVGLLYSVGLAITLVPLSERGLDSNHLALLERVFDLSTAVLSEESLLLCVEVGSICLFWREGIFSISIPVGFAPGLVRLSSPLLERGASFASFGERAWTSS
jgi:hypothetical protein